MSGTKSTSVRDLSLEGETLAYDRNARSVKAKNQARDRFGRWISTGANVRWRADGMEYAGAVKRFEDGYAIIQVRRKDGRVTEARVLPKSLRVLASKATLPPKNNTFFDPENNFAKKLQAKDVKDGFAKEGRAVIERADGYLLDFYEKRPKDEGNPIMYQVFAPGGVSLGQYGVGAEGDFDAMVAEHKLSVPSEAPNTPTGVVASGEEKPFRVPENVKTEIASALSEFSSELSATDMEVASRLANDPTVSLSDVKWVHSFFAATELEERVRGGFKGKKWSTKIVTPTDEELYAPEDDGSAVNRYDFDDDTFDYFGTSEFSHAGEVSQLLAVDYESGAVYKWNREEGFALLPGVGIDDVDEPYITPLDEMTAEAVAKWIDDAPEGEYAFDVTGVDVEERNLFALAEAEMDWDEIDRIATVVASAADGEYTPVERSVNATKQRRGPGGKFGEQPDEPVATDQNKVPVVKARLPMELPLVENPAARITEWIASEASEVPVLAAGTPEEEEAAEPQEAAGDAYPAEEQAIEDGATGPQGEAVYFAVVDEVDKQAVMDAIAIVKKDGQPQAWLRAQGKWTLSPDTLTVLTSATPPPVVEMSDPETVKSVLEQIDTYDEKGDSSPAPEQTYTEPTATEESLVASACYYALPDGSLPIFTAEDLSQAITASAGTSDALAKAHIRKRARALNRMDLVPEEWRTPTLVETGELSASETLYGEFGELLASGARRGEGNAAQLKQYWTRGKGALKIRWGTGGDLTRAHKHLAKYVGLERAWGLAQRYHQSLFGVSNITHDRATGQYRGR